MTKFLLLKKCHTAFPESFIDGPMKPLEIGNEQKVSFRKKKMKEKNASRKNDCF